MLNLIIIFVALTLGGYLAFSRRLAAASDWKATVTPLASIMGSGFLVSAPLLAGIVGNLAVVCMALLLAEYFSVSPCLPGLRMPQRSPLFTWLNSWPNGTFR